MTATFVTREQRGQPHLLVIPRSHRETILDLTDAESAALARRVRDVAKLIARVHDPEGIAVWQNNGVPAHQSVPHVHFHVAGTLPDGGTEWGPVPRLTIAATDAIAARLRDGLAIERSSGLPSADHFRSEVLRALDECREERV